MCKIRQIYWYNLFQSMLASYWVLIGCHLLNMPRSLRFIMATLTTIAFVNMVGPIIEWEDEEE